MKKNILFISGTRADFGKIKPLINIVKKNSSIFNYNIFVTGMHLLPEYGLTINEFKKSGFNNIHPFSNYGDNQSLDMDIALSNTVKGLSNYIKKYPHDLIVVHGDRLEALSGAIVGSFNNILVAHIEGGEVSGTLDELIRHSVTKLSHLHFVSNKKAKNNIIQLGEREKNIFIIGSPETDVMLSNNLPAKKEALKKYDIPFSNYYLFIYHSVTSELNQLKNNVRELVDGIIASEKNYIVIQSNNDSGSDIIRQEYERFGQYSDRIKILPSIRFEYFLAILKFSKGIIGNSSSGVKEAPVFGVPTINIGTRQYNRTDNRHIIHINELKEELLHVLKKSMNKYDPIKTISKGKSAQLFIDVLIKDFAWKISRQKYFVEMK